MKILPLLPDAVWARVAADLMDRAADEFGNHGCNDYDLRGLGLSHDEQIALVTFMHQQNGDPEEIPYSIKALPHTSDFCVMFACTAWLRGMATQATSVAPKENP